LGAAQQDATRRQGANDLNAQMVLQDRAQQLAAAQNLGNLSAQQTATQAQVANTQAGIGDQLHQIQQQFATAPIDLQNWLSQQFAAANPQLFHGSTESGTQNTQGTESQSGTQTGNSSGTNFGFGFKV